MNIVKSGIYDAGTRGVANMPELHCQVDFDPFSLEWDRKFYFGQGTQYNEMTPEMLAEIVKSLGKGSHAMDGKLIWSVRTFKVGVPDQYIHDPNNLRDSGWRKQDPIEMVSFSVYHAENCVERTGHGAYVDRLTDEVILVNGWSSRASVFNSTGIKPVHVTEVHIVEDERQHAVGAGVCLPVPWVEWAVRNASNGIYRLCRGVEDHGAGFKTYHIARDLTALERVWEDNRLEAL